jgi:hypothetical protein
MHHSHAQWPTGGSGSLAFPDARLKDGVLHLWYGQTEENAVIRFREIPLKDLSLESRGDSDRQ